MPAPSSLGALLDSAPPENPAVVAGALAALGIGSGDRVALWLPNLPQWLTLYFALARLGAVTVAINTRFRGAELGDIVFRSGCRALALDPSFRRVDFAGILASVDSASLDRLETVSAAKETCRLACAASTTRSSPATRHWG